MKEMLKILVLFVLYDSYSACVKRNLSVLRAGPGRNHKVLWGVKKYMPLKILKTKGKWVKVVDMDGDESWIQRHLLNTTNKCAIIKSDKAEVFKDPQMKDQALINGRSFAREYETFKLKTKKGKLLEIVDRKGQTYWVSQNHIWTPNTIKLD